jgi:hypothetical protein
LQCIVEIPFLRVALPSIVDWAIIAAALDDGVSSKSFFQCRSIL